MTLHEIEITLERARESLLLARNETGVWEGELSSSALSTATAVVALHTVDALENAALIDRGIGWLIANQNEDGGWGDTLMSFSNISTTLLGWSALNRIRHGIEAGRRAEAWIETHVGSKDPDAIARAVTARYGKDRTFAVPILLCCAICHQLGRDEDAWKRVPALPFELAVFPRSLFASLRLPVVSYALPALIAIGYARFHHAPPAVPLSGFRKWAWPRAAALLRKIQPPHGGFLEATPLTSFVAMALAASGEGANPVVTSGVRFIRASIREDGSWPIDTNLATWCTTLATKALAIATESVSADTLKGQDSIRRSSSVNLPAGERDRIRRWLTGQQFRVKHPYTHAAPGGWAWTDLSGGVPDADDTAGSLLALYALQHPADEAVQSGLSWLLDLQNGDGGIPTFCKGWGAFPFDRSSPDITAHTLRALSAWRSELGASWQWRIDRCTSRALRFLEKEQHPDGSWQPLWFGNQQVAEENNRVYGTAMTVLALEGLPARSAGELFTRGREWLLEQQNEDGGWGGEKGCPSSLEETALALEALAANAGREVLERGAAYLCRTTEGGREFPVSPIGFYFAKLWYYEKSYPQVWTVSALQRVVTRLRSEVWPRTRARPNRPGSAI